MIFSFGLLRNSLMRLVPQSFPVCCSSSPVNHRRIRSASTTKPLKRKEAPAIWTLPNRNTPPFWEKVTGASEKSIWPLEDHQRAITMLEAAAAYRPDSPAALIDLAIAYYGAQQYARALVPAQKALTIDPDNPGAHQMLGKTYFMLGDLGKSTAELERAARLTPNDKDVTYTLGIAYLRNGQAAAAKQLYESMIKDFGELPQLHLAIGRAYRQSGLMQEAMAEFQKTITLDASFPPGPLLSGHHLSPGSRPKQAGRGAG